ARLTMNWTTVVVSFGEGLAYPCCFSSSVDPPWSGLESRSLGAKSRLLQTLGRVAVDGREESFLVRELALLRDALTLLIDEAVVLHHVVQPGWLAGRRRGGH